MKGIGTQEIIYMAIGLLILIVMAILLANTFKHADKTSACGTISGGKGQCTKAKICPEGSRGVDLGCEKDYICCVQIKS